MKALARFLLDTVVRYTYYITMRITHNVLRGATFMIRKTKDDAELDDFGRFSEPALLILVSLAEGPRHGYSMTEDIEAIADVRLGPGTLYGALARLEARGLIEPLKSEDRRNPYRLTALGERALRARLDSMMAVARTGQRRLANA
jgi:DNA-binding PadR family transcriptional regulator